MEKLNLKTEAAFDKAPFTALDRAEARYELLVERLSALGEDIACRIDCHQRVADALVKAAQEQVDRRNGFRLAEKALVTAHRIISNIAPTDTARLVTIYRLLGHVCCRQGKHHEATKYNALALSLQANQQQNSIRRRQ